MVNFTVEEALPKIREEYSCSENEALTMAERLMNVKSPELDIYVESWFRGENKPFEFLGITSDYIMEKERGSYLGAIFSMSVLLEQPDLVELYKICRFL